MMRALLAFAAMALVASPAAKAQEPDPVQEERDLTEGGRWLARLAEAIATGSESARELNQGMQALVAKPLTRERISAAVPALRAQIERSREDVRRSNAILDSLPALSPAVAREIEPEKQIRELRAYNVRRTGLLDAFDAFVVAMAKGDSAAAGRALPRILEGSLDMLSQQRLLLRTRQASTPVSESTHQSLGIAGQLYRAMEAIHRATIIARSGGEAEGTKAAVTLREELRLVAQETRALAEAGRRNVAREIAELDEEGRGSAGAEARTIERIRAVYVMEERVYVLGDRLAAFADASGAITAAQLRALGASSALAPLRPLEDEMIAINADQAGLLAGAR
jgi:hypothetical protein